jgi:hypothetical protein
MTLWRVTCASCGPTYVTTPAPTTAPGHCPMCGAEGQELAIVTPWGYEGYVAATWAAGGLPVSRQTWMEGKTC